MPPSLNRKSGKRTAGRASYLDRLMTSLEVQVKGFALCKVGRGYRLMLGGLDAPVIHYVLKGPGIVQIHEGPSLSFVAHDFLIIPPRLAHSIIVAPGDLEEVRGTDGLSTLGDALLEISAGAGADAVTACASIEATFGGGIGLFDAVREPIAESLGPDERLRGAMAIMVAELSAPTFGTRAIVEALLKQCLVLIIRRQVHGAGKSAAWFLPSGDARLNAALSVMLQRPDAPHTLRGLAEVASMSRSSFSLRFAAAFGQPPMEFLRDLRLRHAARLLEVTDLPVPLVAKSVGYTSRSYFTRAFRNLFGMDPRSYRAARR